MEFMTSAEQRDFDNAFNLGRIEGRITGKRELLSMFLSKRFRLPYPAAKTRLHELSEHGLDDLALDVLDLESKADLNHWLKVRKAA